MSHIQIPWSHWLFTPFSSLTQFEKHAYILNMTNKTIDCLPAMQQKRSTQVPHLAIWLWFSTFSRTLSEPPATYVNWWILSRSPLKMATSGKSATLVEDSISLPVPPYTFGSISIPGNPPRPSSGVWGFASEVRKTRFHQWEKENHRLKKYLLGG